MRTMTDEQAETVLLAAQQLAIVVRDEGPDAVRRAAQRVLTAAGHDPIAAVTAAAVAICIDHAPDVWWQRPRTAPLEPYQHLEPCGTHAAFERHRLAGEEPDDECRQAERVYQAQSYADRRNVSVAA